ncbi:protein-tyrosine-phosphatase MKP1 [Phalaenopsis equestris]|uniref:protein-tyrosine-phosphatase MKP1 n=1 Tax=Phalaenopsis equestris TaxID=78828 RepID=UPI0009E52070|nr:protein-tyrosine-phosphatase MKP1 [Phalaenopsis equestris]XP_020574409.1 protein-tyrosine-phosphatase MKP1 [Phalaenopsis equestris]
MRSEEDSGSVPIVGGRKAFWRSASWSSSRTASVPDDVASGDASENASSNGQFRRFPPTPLTPRSNSSKARSCLPPLQPLSIARRSLDEWPKASSDDVGECLQPPTPSGRAEPSRPGEGLKVDLSSLRSQVKKDQIAFFDKECSKVADHIYLGGDYVARNREILRENGITHVLNCVGFVCAEYFKAHLVYKTLWLQDSPTEDITSILYDVFDYFEDVREQGGRVLVHCCQGVSRSTSLVIAYLMWREGQSFDDAFQFVKAARGIANPNMGFACQLLQCQKRVHAIPLSPNSGLRMYRMAPHSPYDALHLVPKMLNDPSSAALDSRGAFILHVVCTIFVWIGKNCDLVIEKDAKAAAFQVVRYEKVPGPIITVEEGEEPADFWDAFSNPRAGLDNATNVEKEEVESGRKPIVGKRRVEAYDVDFDLFYQAITGGVVPPFPSSGPGQETHLPARESNWSILRRKFLSRTMFKVFSNSALIQEVDPHVNRVQILNAESSTSPTYLSPNSFSSDSSGSSKSSSESPTISPSTSSSPMLTPSPASRSLPKPVILPSKSSQHDPEQPRTNLQATQSPSRDFSRSIAERRGSFSLLKLPTLNKDASLSSRKVIGASPTYLESTQKIFDNQASKPTPIGDDACSKDMVVEPPVLKNLGEFNGRGLRDHADLDDDHLSGDDNLRSGSIDLLDSFQESGHSFRALIFRWPNFEKMTAFSRENLHPQEVLIFLLPATSKDSLPFRKVCLWIGSSFKQVNGENQFGSGENIKEVNQINWNEVGRNFLAFMELPIDLPIKVFEEQDPEKFLEMMNTTWNLY